MAQTPIASSETSGRGANFLRWCKRNWKGIAGAFLLLVIIGVGAFFALPSQRGIPYRVAEETYTLVRDKISSSAAIALALPKGVEMTAAEAQAKVTFEPPLEGSWTAGSEKGELFFEPEDKLTLGSYYTVSLETPDGILSKDFLIDEDPKILSWLLDSKDSPSVEIHPSELMVKALSEYFIWIKDNVPVQAEFGGLRVGN